MVFVVRKTVFSSTSKIHRIFGSPRKTPFSGPRKLLKIEDFQCIENLQFSNASFPPAQKNVYKIYDFVTANTKCLHASHFFSSFDFYVYETFSFVTAKIKIFARHENLSKLVVLRQQKNLWFFCMFQFSQALIFVVQKNTVKISDF